MRNPTACCITKKTHNTTTLHHLAGEDATQRDVFEDCRPVVDGVLAGVNGTIMAYGQARCCWLAWVGSLGGWGWSGKQLGGACCRMRAHAACRR